MRKASLAIFLATITAGLTYAGNDATPAHLAVALPQPSTIFICLTGLLFSRSVNK